MIDFFLNIFILISVVALFNKYILQYRGVRIITLIIAFNVFNHLNLIAFRDVVGVVLIIDFVIFLFKAINHILYVIDELK